MRYALLLFCLGGGLRVAQAQAPAPAPAQAPTQTPVLRGRVLDAETQRPVPNARVGVGRNRLGTSANAEGRFALPVPAQHQSGALEIGALGYETSRQPLPPLPGPELLVRLRPRPAELGEVAVSGSVLGLVREAVARIPRNYPTRPTRLEGFFRESDNLLPVGPYRYLGEATLLVLKAPYSRPHDDGEVVIRQARKVDLVAGKVVVRPKWYGGPFIPHRFDFVHNRLDFINEADFCNYDYRIANLTTFDGRPVYVIAFGPKPGNTHANFEGQLYLDQDSYAFLAAEWHRTPAGLRHEQVAFNAEERAYRVDYQPYGGRWHLKSVWYSTRGTPPLGGPALRHLAEFLTTAIDTTTAPPPGYTERAQLRDIFLDNSVAYDSAFWQHQTTLLPPEQLRAALRDQERQQQAEQLFAPRPAAPLSASQKLLGRLRVGYAGGLLPLTTPATDVTLTLAPGNSAFQVTAHGATPARRGAGWYGTVVQLDITRYLAAYYLSRQVFGKFGGLGWEVGATYERNLRPHHRPVLLRAGLGYARQRVRYGLGTFANPDRRLRLDGKRLNADQLSVAPQLLTDAWQPRLGVGLELSHRLEAVADVGYLLPIRTRAEVYVAEKSGFFALRRHVDAALPATGATLLINGAPTPPPWRLSRPLLTVGLLYRLR